MTLLKKSALMTVLLWIAPALTSQAQAQQTRAKKDIQITWLGHAAFEVVSSGGTRILIDPFLKENPATPPEFKDLSRYKPNFILVTHSHGDHMGDAIEIAKASKAKIVTINFPVLFQKEGLPEELVQTARLC